MINTIEAWPVILHMKGIKITIQRFHLFFRIKGMINAIEAWLVILYIKNNETPKTAIVARKRHKGYLNFNKISVPWNVIKGIKVSILILTTNHALKDIKVSIKK